MAVTTAVHAGTLTLDADFASPYNTPSYDGFSTDLVETTSSNPGPDGGYAPVGPLSGTVTEDGATYDAQYSIAAAADQEIFPDGHGGFRYDLGGLSFDLLTQTNHAYVDTVNIAFCGGSSLCGGLPGYMASLGSEDGGQFLLSSYAPVNGDVTLTGGVPEPASWALMLVGFGVVGSAFRRKSRISIV